MEFFSDKQFESQDNQNLNNKNKSGIEDQKTGIISFMNNDFLCDIVLKVEHRETFNKEEKAKVFFFPCHKVILASCSKYVYTMLEQANEFPLERVSEEDSDKFKNIEIIDLPELISFMELSKNKPTSNDNISKDSLVFIVLKYAYSNQNFSAIAELLNESNVYKVLSLSTSLQIEKLNLELSKYISTKGLLSIENCCRTLKEAIILENVSLEDECLKLINNHFEIVANNILERKSLLDLPYDTFKKIASSNELVVTNEKLVCDLILEYINIRKEIEIVKKDEKLDGGIETNLKAVEVKNNEENIDQNELQAVKEGENSSINEKDKDKEKEINQEVKEPKNNDIPIAVKRFSVIAIQKEKISKIKENILINKLSAEQEKELIRLIRFSYLSHKELLSLNNVDILKDSKDLILEGISIRLNPYEGIENQQINYRINLNPRKFKGTFGDSKQKFNPVKSYEDTNSKNKFNRQPQTTNTFNPVGSLSSQPQQLGLQNQNNLNYLQQSQQSNFSRPPQNI